MNIQAKQFTSDLRTKKAGIHLISGAHLTGKTAFLKKICLELIQNHKGRIPVYIECSKIESYGSIKTASENSNEAFLQEVI